MPEAVPNVLSIAGIDPSGGAGLYADLKTFAALRTYGCGVVAALTAQNTQGVRAVHVPPADFLRAQLDTLFADVAIAATKTGMLASAAVIETATERLAHWRAQGQSPIVVVDPVMVAKSGDALLDRQAVGALVEALLPLATVITPNLPEAAVLLGRTAPESRREMIRAAEALRALLPTDDGHWVLLKGGHLPGSELVDLLFDGEHLHEFVAPKAATKNTHGTGCTYAAAIAALAARASLPLTDAAMREVVREAHRYLQGAIAASGALAVGHGHGPLHHFHALWL